MADANAVFAARPAAGVRVDSASVERMGRAKDDAGAIVMVAIEPSARVVVCSDGEIALSVGKESPTLLGSVDSPPVLHPYDSM